MLILGCTFTPAIAQAQTLTIPRQLSHLNPVQTEAALLGSDRLAQIEPNPNQDRFLQAPDDPVPETLPPDELIITPDTDPVDPSTLDNATPLTIEGIEVSGSTVFTEADFAPIVDPLIGETTLGALQQAVEQITQLYINQGYLTSRAVLPAQALGQSSVSIDVIEGSLEAIAVEGLNRLNESYVTSRVGLGIDTPLNVNDLEDQLRLLQLDPNLDELNVALQSGDATGTSVLKLVVDEANPFFGSAGLDNYSAASVGSTRSTANLSYRNLVGIGDVLSLDYTQTFTNGLDTWGFGYTAPLNPLNGTLNLSFTTSRNRIITSPFDLLNIRGESESYQVSLRQPLVRRATEEFALSLGFTHSDGQTFVFDTIGQPFSAGAEADGTTKTSVLRFGQDYTKRDINGAWSLRSQFSLGTELLDATQNSGSTPDGQFLSWLGQVARVQRLSNTNTLIIQADLQLTGDNLLSSEGFSIGGAQTLRGYRQGARNGDNGWRLTIEDRITLWQTETGQILQIAPFFDYGVVWNNPSNPSQITGEHVLAGLGTGILFQPIDNLALRLDFAIPLVNLSDRQEDLQDDGIYFSLAYGF
ncbi:MAG: ShlB/FhaC/HecB family hemolysin secretion/activation protein [Spirulina sp. SIO3F2]|nr:ShlB/FhaC/HecB family hemolysin secretion/activation protein [Spirulina sp. SIO3F2]